MCWLVSPPYLIQTRVTWKEGVSWEIASTRLICEHIFGGALLISERHEGSAPLWVVHSWACEHGLYKICIRYVEQAKRSKSVRSILSWSVFWFLHPGSCFELFLWLLSTMGNCTLVKNKSLPPKGTFRQCFTTAAEIKPERKDTWNISRLIHQ